MRGSSFIVCGFVFVACSASDDASPTSPVDAGGDVILDVVSDNDTSGDAADSGSDAPLTDAGPDDGDASACTLTKPYSSSNTTCNTCAEQHCCEAVNACYADPDCDDGYVNCALACALLPDDAGDAGIAECLSDCGSQYPTGEQEYDAAIGCADTSCSVECQ